MKRTVERPPRSIQSRARAMTARTSATPLLVAESVSKGASTASASRRASVVLPTPGGPHRTIDARRPRSTIRRSAPRSPTSWSWPTNSARSVGRIRAARGAWSRGPAKGSASGPAEALTCRGDGLGMDPSLVRAGEWATTI